MLLSLSLFLENISLSFNYINTTFYSYFNVLYNSKKKDKGSVLFSVQKENTQDIKYIKFCVEKFSRIFEQEFGQSSVFLKKKVNFNDIRIDTRVSPERFFDNSERLRNPTASNVSARQASTVRGRIGWRSSTSVNQTVGEVHRVPAIRDRSSCPNWRGNERGRNNGGAGMASESVGFLPYRLPTMCSNLHF